MKIHQIKHLIHLAVYFLSKTENKTIQMFGNYIFCMKLSYIFMFTVSIL